MNKVTACILVALALGFIIYIDVLSHAPVWSIYMEMVGIFLAFLAGLLYLLHHNKEKRGDGDHFDA
jgi:peptidoglycan/LPS O-acetylase OafA/YrhL